MAISKEFIEAVETGNLLRVRIMLKDSLLVDPTASYFNEMSNYAMSRLKELYVEHDGEESKNDAASWTEDYLNEQMVKAVTNFSRLRVDLLIRMVQYLYKNKVHKTEDTVSDSPQASCRISRKHIGVGVTVTGAAIAVAGICISQTLLTIGGAVVAATGVVILVSDKADE